MHTFGETGTAVPAFLAKLWRLVEDPETNNLIYWSKDGRSFIIQNQAQFARELLPMNYKHNNMASFIRQLNMYGFHKITSIENGGLKFDKDEMEFSHPCFKREYPYLLEHIKRKIANSKGAPDEKANMKPEAVSKVLNEVKVMRGRQDSLDSRFSAMKQENEALWREIAVLRQKHLKQQQIVNKLIQFLVTIVQPSRNMSGVKRHFQLMINDAPKSSKVRKSSEGESGPTIHELELLEEDGDSETELAPLDSPHVSSPGGASVKMGFEVGEEAPSPLPETPTNFFNQQQDSNQDDETILGSNITNTSGHTAQIIQIPNNPYVVYHINEVPDNNETDTQCGVEETNTLNTPMVKKEIAHNQLKSRKRKWRDIQNNGMNDINTLDSQNNSSGQVTGQQIRKIKTENEVDPLMFLEVSEDVLDPNLLSTINKVVQEAPASDEAENARQMYTNKEDFICSEIPTELFEDSSILNDNLANASSNQMIDLNLNSKELENAKDDGDKSKALLAGKNLTLAKYNSNQTTDDEIMRLSTAADFNNHLENVQGDLENLKELLKGDSGLSLDANALLGASSPANRLILPSFDGDLLAKLFSDSDLLANYGLSWNNNELQNNCKKEGSKGSELMTYQPYYTDLTEMLDINADSILDDSANPAYDNKTSSSTLNTPFHEVEDTTFKPK